MPTCPMSGPTSEVYVLPVVVGAVSETGPLPVIDMSDLRRDPRGSGAERTIAALRRACRDRGFFSLVGHGIDSARTARVLALAREFFALPQAEKLKIENVNSPQFRGYTRVGQERTNRQPDRREQLDIGVERDTREPGPGEPAYWRLHGPNQWPASLPELREVLLAYMEDMEQIALVLVRALARSLGQPADRFDSTFTPDPSPHLKIIRYPSVTDASDQGVGAHKDYGYLAILLQDETGGLQVGAPGGFTDVLPEPGTFVCNIGEMFEVTSRGYYEATVHRVVSPPAGRDRVSVPFFYGPRLDARLAPVDLPAELDAAGGRSRAMPDPDNPIYAEYGQNALRGWLRSHPEVARRHWADLVPNLQPAGSHE
jgi:isopenicillin N synthase-like dioxygenase